MSDSLKEAELVAADLWAWMREFVAVKNEFYGGKFPPCPFALGALMAETVDVVVWRSGDVKAFVRQNATNMRLIPEMTTRVMAFPPRTQFTWRLTEFVESLNAELIPHNVFLNTGVAKTTTSRYPGSRGNPYFIVIANSLDAVLKGADALKRTNFYEDWPKSHFEIVVQRRQRMARRYGVPGQEAGHR
ncbi:MAG: hypothetical protein H0X25_07225 [Acidobacteriales bacterium]|nr:hypothetical protein [Terriglobales bacterium]